MGTLKFTDQFADLERLPSLAGSARVWPEEAFAALFRQHYGRLVGVVVRLVGERARAEEIAGDAFWKLYHRPALQGENHNVPAWLYRTATRMGLDALRARRRAIEARQRATAEAAGVAAPANGPLQALVRGERAAAVRRTLRRLKPAHAQILVLRHSGLSYEEVATVLRIKASSVGTTLARAEAAFERTYLEEEEL